MTLSEKFDQALGEQIAKAIAASEARLDIAIELAKEIPDSFAVDVLEKIQVSKGIVDKVARGLHGKSITDYTSEVLEAARGHVQALERGVADTKYQGQYLHRSTERRG